MPLLVNLRHLAVRNLVLEGELPAGALDIDTRDEMIRLTRPVAYAFEVQKLDQALLLRGRLAAQLDCQCVRCLKPFRYDLELTDWTCHVPLSGEDSVPVIADCVDLTPQVREDILLEFPRHPTCEPECRGLESSQGRSTRKNVPGPAGQPPPAWAELDRLKF